MSHVYVNTGYEDMPDNFEDSLIITDPAIMSALAKLRASTGRQWVCRQKVGYTGLFKLFKIALYDLFIFEQRSGRYRIEGVSLTDSELHTFINGIIACSRISIESGRGTLRK